MLPNLSLVGGARVPTRPTAFGYRPAIQAVANESPGVNRVMSGYVPF